MSIGRLVAVTLSVLFVVGLFLAYMIYGNTIREGNPYVVHTPTTFVMP